MDYPCGKFSYCNFSRFSSIVRTDTQTHTQTDVDERFTPATLVGVSNCTDLLEFNTAARVRHFTRSPHAYNR